MKTFFVLLVLGMLLSSYESKSINDYREEDSAMEERSDPESCVPEGGSCANGEVCCRGDGRVFCSYYYYECRKLVSPSQNFSS